MNNNFSKNNKETTENDKWEFAKIKRAAFKAVSVVAMASVMYLSNPKPVFASAKRNISPGQSGSATIVFTPNGNSSTSISALLSDKALSGWMKNEVEKLNSNGSIFGVGGGVPLYYNPISGKITVSGHKYGIAITTNSPTWKGSIPVSGVRIQKFYINYASGSGSNTESVAASGSIAMYNVRLPHISPIIYNIVVSPSSYSKQTQPLTQVYAPFNFYGFFGQQNIMQSIVSNIKDSLVYGINTTTSNYIGGMINNLFGINQSRYALSNVEVGKQINETWNRFNGANITFAFKSKNGNVVKFVIPDYYVKETVSKDGGMHMAGKEMPFVGNPELSGVLRQ